MSYLPVIAHAGHWSLWVLYAVPVVVVLIATAQAFIRERRARRGAAARE
jgi:cytochrome c-type biogenesis protein CcmH/NrfF